MVIVAKQQAGCRTSLRRLKTPLELPAAVVAHRVVHHRWRGAVGGDADRDDGRVKRGPGGSVRLDNELRAVRREDARLVLLPQSSFAGPGGHGRLPIDVVLEGAFRAVPSG